MARARRRSASDLGRPRAILLHLDVDLVGVVADEPQGDLVGQDDDLAALDGQAQALGDVGGLLVGRPLGQGEDGNHGSSPVGPPRVGSCPGVAAGGGIWVSCRSSAAARASRAAVKWGRVPTSSRAASRTASALLSAWGVSAVGAQLGYSEGCWLMVGWPRGSGPGRRRRRGPRRRGAGRGRRSAGGTAGPCGRRG